MVDIVKLGGMLRSRVEWQETPRPIEFHEYLEYVMYGVSQYYALTSRPGMYDDSKIVYDEFNLPYQFDGNLNAAETEYVLINAQILFFKKVQ